MKIDSLSLPHPVIGVGDDIKSIYEASAEREIFNDIILIKVVHSMDNSSLKEMIKNGEAQYATEIDCGQTLYRKMFLGSDKNQSIEIDVDDLRDKVYVNFYLVATAETDSYRPSALNEDYEDTVFSISKGDVLGYGGSTSFYANKAWKESETISNFMCIVKADKKEGTVEYELASDRINIKLPEKDYEKYKKVGSDYKRIYNIYHSAIVYPALVFALVKYLEKSDSDAILQQYKWYDVITDRLKDDSRFQKIDLIVDNAPEIAQLLLSSKEEGSPLTRTLNCLDDIIDDTYNTNV